jgi:hypothetical protein
VLDEVVGWSYAVVTFVVGGRLFDRWVAWRETKKGHGQDPAELASEADSAPVALAAVEADAAVG